VSGECYKGRHAIIVVNLLAVLEQSAAPSRHGSHVDWRACHFIQSADTALYCTPSRARGPVHSCCSGHDNDDMTLDVTAEQTASQYTAAAADDDDDDGDAMPAAPTTVMSAPYNQSVTNACTTRPRQMKVTVMTVDALR